MAQTEVKVLFKVDGIDGYITDLNELQDALTKTTTDTQKLSDSQEKAADDIEDTTNSISF
jgi:ABC-type transporter Mla subunit MlaD